MQTVLVTGGTGLVGTALVKELLKNNYKVAILTRSPEKYNAENPLLEYAGWDINKGTIDINAIQQADYIVHLAGAGVAEKRWTEKRKKEIISSRVKSSELIVKALKENTHKVKAVISASAIGWYGADHTPDPSPKGEGRNGFMETDPAANDFLGTTCKLWEEAINPVAEIDIRLVKLRTGIVLSNDGGAFKEFIKPLQFKVAAILGSGKQIISWVHIDDMVKMYMAAIENDSFKGVYNAVGPNPVSNKLLITTIAKVKGGFYIPIPVPAFMLKIILGEMSVEVLKSTTVSAEKLLNNNFSFAYPTIETAVKKLITHSG